MSFRGFLFVLLLAHSAVAQTKVGMVTREFTDESRRKWEGTAARPLRTAVWYPAAMNAEESETIFGGPPDKEVFAPVSVAPGVDISGVSPAYPLVLLSHGTGGSAVQMIWLGHYLASHGYIVAAVNHHGNTAAERQPAAQGFLLYWERAQDLSAVLDKMLADPMFGRRINRERIGAAGFSLGGYTVITIAGGRFSPKQFANFCTSPQRDFTCEPQPEFRDAHKLFEDLKKRDPVVRHSLRRAGNSFRDSRIKRVFAIAPALGSGFTPAGLGSINIPVAIVVGAADKITPPPTNAERYAKFIRNSTITILPGEIGHYTFLAECNERGRRIVDICREADSTDRVQVHRQVAEMALKFFGGSTPPSH